MKLRPQTSRIFRAVSRRLHDAARHLEQPGTKTGRRLPEARLLALGKLDEALWLNQPWFQSLHIATVLDIGANTGQFSAMIRIVLPRAYIHAFEPLPDCYDRLKKRMAGDARFTAHNLAIGEEAGELQFERNAFSQSSSFLKMTDAHTTAFPHTKDTQTVKVQVGTLDALAPSLAFRAPLLVKIDVEGFEDRVLRGGENTVRGAAILILETAFEPLYSGQWLFNDVYEALREWGFDYFGSLEQRTSPQDGRLIQADSIFLKRSASPPPG